MKDDIEELTSRAEKAEDEGDLESALCCWESLCSIAPSDDSYLLDYAWVARKLMRWEESEAAYMKALALNQSAFAMEGMGWLWSERDDKEEQYAQQIARDWLLRSIELEPVARVYSLLACVYGDLEDIDSAIKACEEALILDSNYEEAMYNLGFLIEKTDPDRALKLHEQALELDPIYAPPHQSLGRIHQRKKDYVQAEYHFRRCLELAPSDYFTTLFLANTLATQQRNAEADEMYQKALTLGHGNERCYELYANFLEFSGEEDRAANVRTQISEASFFSDPSDGKD